MAVSQEQLDNLDRTIVSGEEEVQDRGRRVRLRPVAELLQARQFAAAEAAKAAGRAPVRRVLACAK